MIRTTIHTALACAFTLAAWALPTAQAAEGNPPSTSPNAFGFPCLYTHLITQHPDHCVVAYLDRNSKTYDQPITAANLADVHSYLVLHDKDKNGRFIIQTYYPDGKRKTNRIAVEASPDLLQRNTMAALKANGDVIQWWPNEKPKAELFYENGVLWGEAKHFNEDGTPNVIATYRNGSREGRVIEYHPGGKPSREYYYRNGKLDGRYTTRFPTGQIESQTEYLEGYLNGTFVTYYPNGQRASQSQRYFNAYEGPFRRWHENGKLAYEAIYLDGQLTQMRRWFPNGKPEEEAHYVANKRHGESKTWYQSGHLKTVETYRKGQLDGPTTKYFENGKTRSQGQYANGKPEGIRTQWELYKDQRVEFSHVDGKETGFKVFRPDGTVGEYDTPQ